MTTTSTSGDYTRTAALQPQIRGDDSGRFVNVTLIRDDLPVMAVFWPAEASESLGRRADVTQTWTAATAEAAALAAVTVEDLLTIRAAHDTSETHQDGTGLTVADGLAASWLAEDFP